jgi:hypothetical protein
MVLPIELEVTIEGAAMAAVAAGRFRGSYFLTFRNLVPETNFIPGVPMRRASDEIRLWYSFR